MEIKIDIDQQKLHARSLQERTDFQTTLFDVGSRLTTQYGAKIDFSDPLHWIIRIDDQHENAVRGLLASASA